MDVTGMISELRGEVEAIEQEIFLLERLDTRADRPVVLFVIETAGVLTRSTMPEPNYSG